MIVKKYSLQLQRAQPYSHHHMPIFVRGKYYRRRTRVFDSLERRTPMFHLCHLEHRFGECCFQHRLINRLIALPRVLTEKLKLFCKPTFIVPTKIFLRLLILLIVIATDGSYQKIQVV